VALILASTSAIRQQMLTAAGVPFEAVAPELDEDSIKRGFHGDDASLARTLAAAKATAAGNRVGAGDWVIGSDSVVSVEGERFSKPRDRADASDHLRRISGRKMQLTSAVALARGGRGDWVIADHAVLHTRRLSEDFIAQYLDAEWPEVGYTVGVFRLEGRGVQLFEQIDGDHFTILGMPLLPLLGALRERHVIAS
jgi:septum formation protein